MTTISKLPTAPLILVVAIFAGCSSQSTLTINSLPAGAYMTEHETNTAYGRTPVTVYYNETDLRPTRRADGCYVVKGFDAAWISGASASLEAMALCGSATGRYTITYVRDQASPGFDKDAEFGLKVQALRAQQQQAAAATSLAITSLANSLSKSVSSGARLSCSSSQVGGSVYTNCN